MYTMYEFYSAYKNDFFLVFRKSVSQNIFYIFILFPGTLMYPSNAYDPQ